MPREWDNRGERGFTLERNRLFRRGNKVRKKVEKEGRKQGTEAKNGDDEVDVWETCSQESCPIKDQRPINHGWEPSTNIICEPESSDEKNWWKLMRHVKNMLRTMLDKCVRTSLAMILAASKSCCENCWETWCTPLDFWECLGLDHDMSNVERNEVSIETFLWMRRPWWEHVFNRNSGFT